MRNRMLQAVLCLAMVAAFASCAATDTRRSSGQYLDDNRIEAAVKTDLAMDPITKAHLIEVEVYKGVVQLSGFVVNKDSIQRAEEIAKDARGVKSVQNNLTLR